MLAKGKEERKATRNKKEKSQVVRKKVIEKVAVAVTSSNSVADDIKKSMRKLEGMEVEVLLSPLTEEILNKNIRRANFVEPYSTPEKRYDDLIWALEQNPDIIVALTGGNGAGELIPFIKGDIEYLRRKKTALMGFSDVTVLVNLWAFLGNPAYIGPCFEDTDELIDTIKKIIKGKSEFVFSFGSAEPGEMKSGESKNIIKEWEKEAELTQKMKGVWGGNISSFISFLITDIEVNGRSPKHIKKGNPLFVFEETFEGYNRIGTEFTFDWIAELLLTAGISEKFIAWGKIQKPREVKKKYFKTMMLKRSSGILLFDLEFSHDDMEDVVIPIGYNVEAEVHIYPDKEGEVIFRANWINQKEKFRQEKKKKEVKGYERE